MIPSFFKKIIVWFSRYTLICKHKFEIKLLWNNIPLVIWYTLLSLLVNSIFKCLSGFTNLIWVQLLIRVRLFVTPWTAACQASLSTLTLRVYSDSYLLSQWCHPTISSSVVPFSSRLQSFPASGSFHKSQFSSGGQSAAASASNKCL